jgi:hypothetical protein
VEGLEERWTPAALTWTGGGQTNVWSDSRNWSTSTTPTNLDDLVFDNTAVSPNSIVDNQWTVGTVHSLTIAANYPGTITLARDLTATTVDQEGGTIGGTDGALIVSGTLTWGGGTESGSPTGRPTGIMPNALLVINGGGTRSSMGVRSRTPDGRPGMGRERFN